MPAKKMSDDDLVAAIHQFLDTSPARDLRQQTAAAAIGVSQSLIAKVSSGRWESWRYEALAKRVAGATLDARADGRFPSLQEVSRRSGLTMSQVQHGFADVIASASGIDPSTPPARRRADELQARFEQIVDTAITNAKYKEDLVWARLREQANYRLCELDEKNFRLGSAGQRRHSPARCWMPLIPPERFVLATVATA